MNVSTCATCLLLSCWASLITSFTAGCCRKRRAIKSFCAARYGSALLAWLNATTNCFLPGVEQPASNTASTIVQTLISPIPPALHRYREHDNHRLDHHLHVAVHIIQ